MAITVRQPFCLLFLTESVAINSNKTRCNNRENTPKSLACYGGLFCFQTLFIIITTPAELKEKIQSNPPTETLTGQYHSQKTPVTQSLVF
jgi:hypothetical protein